MCWPHCGAVWIEPPRAVYVVVFATRKSYTPAVSGTRALCFAGTQPTFLTFETEPSLTSCSHFNLPHRAVGGLPGVAVFGTSDVLSASLFADEYCGEGTSLIHYVKLGSVVSRTFTSKDTHSPHGDLLVVFGTEGTAHNGKLAKRTAAVLGFEAPSFTTGTDLFLPVEANADLRAALAPDGDVEAALLAIDDVLEIGNISAVPQVRSYTWGPSIHYSFFDISAEAPKSQANVCMYVQKHATLETISRRANGTPVGCFCTVCFPSVDVLGKVQLDEHE